MRIGSRHDQPGERNRPAQHLFFVDEIDFGHALWVTVKRAQGLDGLGDGGVEVELGGQVGAGGGET